jgi:hypothetical protein
MPRTRMIKPEFWSDEKIAQLSLLARLLYIGIWNCSDDFGVVKGHPTWLKSQIFPYDDKITPQDVEGALGELENLGRIVPFLSDEERYFDLPFFRKHQTVNRPSKRRNPERIKNNSQTLTEPSLNTHRALIDEREREREREKERESVYVSECSDLAKLLFKEVKANRERNALTPPDEPNLKEWGEEIKSFLGKNGVKPHYLRQVILWSQNDPFWWGKITSAKKLTEHFKSLETAMAQEENKESKRSSERKKLPGADYPKFEPEETDDF